MARRSLHSTLVRYAALVGLLPFLLMGVLGFILLLPQAKKDLNLRQQELAGAIATATETFLAGSRAMVVAAAADVEAHYNRGKQIGEAFLSASVKSLPALRAIYIVDGNGRIVATSGRGSAQFQRDLIGADLSLNPLVKEGLTKRVEQWSDNYLSLIGRGIVVAVAVPCGKGLAVGELELDRLSDFLKKIEWREGQEILILDSRGQVISGRDKSFSAQQINLSNIPLVRKGLIDGSSGTDEFELQDRLMVGSTHRLSAMNWSVLVAQPREHVYRQLVTSSKIAGLCMLVSLILALGYAVMFARGLARRFGRLADQANIVATGTCAVDWPHAGIAEFDGLASSLQRMSDTLHERALLLEQEIAERQKAEEDLRGNNEALAAVKEELREQLNELLVAQEELVRREEEFRTVADWTYDWECWVTPERKFRYISPSCERVSGYSPQEFVADHRLMERIVHPDDKEGYLLHVNKCLSPEGSSPGETNTAHFRILSRDGEVRWIEHLCRPVYSSSGTFLGRRASNRDVTERRQLEQQLLQQQKLEGIGMLAGGIAHDFNNMLTPVFGYADMIKARVSNEGPVRQWANAISESAEKAKNLVKQLLSFSRKQMLSVRRHDLNRIVVDFVHVLRRTIRENIEIRQNLATCPCPVDVDRTQVEQILLNLTVNAQDAITGTGVITIGTAHVELDGEAVNLHPGARPGRYILLSFSDTGCGMHQSVKEHIFEPFFTTKGVGSGTGLGLSTSYGIIKQHNGFVDVVSHPGGGTAFGIYLPAGEAAAGVETEAPAPVPTDAAGGGVILVVEDNPMVLSMMRDLLEVSRYEVLAAAVPEEALEVAGTAGRIDLLISDVVMPQMTGPEMYERLRVLRPGLKVLFVSGYASTSVFDNGLLEEGACFLSKPFTSDALLRQINQLLPAAH